MGIGLTEKSFAVLRFILGIDMNKAMLKRARRQAKKLGVAETKWFGNIFIAIGHGKNPAAR